MMGKEKLEEKIIPRISQNRVICFLGTQLVLLTYFTADEEKNTLIDAAEIQH